MDKINAQVNEYTRYMNNIKETVCYENVCVTNNCDTVYLMLSYVVFYVYKPKNNNY